MKTIAGLLRWKRRVRSERVEIGFAGETTTPSERSAKQRIGTWMRFGERMSAVSPLESLRIEVKLFARVSMRLMTS